MTLELNELKQCPAQEPLTVIPRSSGSLTATRREQVGTLYFRACIVHQPGKRPVVSSYEPAQWPYPPEKDCQDEWDESKV